MHRAVPYHQYEKDDLNCAEARARLLSKHTFFMKQNVAKSFIAVLALSAVTLLAQTPAPTPHSGQAELSKVEEWVLSQGTEQSIAPELAAILGLGSDRLPVKVKAYVVANGINRAFAVSTNPKQEGIVLSALKTMTEKLEIYSVGTAWLTDKSGILHQTIQVDASGARVVPNNSRAAEFKDIKGVLHQETSGHRPHYVIALSQNICNSRGREKGSQVIRVL